MLHSFLFVHKYTPVSLPRPGSAPAKPGRPGLAGAALGNSRMDFISQAAVVGGLAIENQTRSLYLAQNYRENTMCV